MNCNECIHAEMCKWIDQLGGRGCDFLDGEQEPLDCGNCEIVQASINTGIRTASRLVDDVLEQIRAEIDSYCSDNRDRNDGLYIAMRIIDKYKAESEE